MTILQNISNTVNSAYQNSANLHTGRTQRNYAELKSFVNGNALSTAKQLVGLSDGRGKEHHQQCPQCEVPGYIGKGTPPFYYRKGGSFHCRKCTFSGDIIDLIAKVKQITKADFV